MITRADVDRAFEEQRQLTTQAIEEGPGLESYLTNLGFDFHGLYAWTYEYTLGNVIGSKRNWSDDDITFVASLLTRTMAVGLILGRDTKP